MRCNLRLFRLGFFCALFLALLGTTAGADGSVTLFVDVKPGLALQVQDSLTFQSGRGRSGSGAGCYGVVGCWVGLLVALQAFDDQPVTWKVTRGAVHRVIGASSTEWRGVTGSPNHRRRGNGGCSLWFTQDTAMRRKVRYPS